MQQFHQLVVQSQSVNKAERENGKYLTQYDFLIPFVFTATKFFENLVLDGNTTQLMLDYIDSTQVDQSSRQMAAIQLKNVLKQAYKGSGSDSHYSDKKGA